MNLIIGTFLIIISILKLNLIKAGGVALLSLILLFPQTKIKKFVSIFVILTLIPPFLAPEKFNLLMLNSLKITIRFSGFFLIILWINKKFSEIDIISFPLPTSITAPVTLALNILPQMNEFFSVSTKQLRKRRGWIRDLPEYVKFLLAYVTNFAEELGKEVEITLSLIENDKRNY